MDSPDKIKTTETLFIAMGWGIHSKLPIIYRMVLLCLSKRSANATRMMINSC